MKQQNKNIEELFKDKLQNIEADPGANAWANIQTGLSAGTTSATVASNSVSWASSAIVGVVITAVAVGGYFFFNNEGEKKIQPNQETIEVPANEKDEVATPIISTLEEVEENLPTYNEQNEDVVIEKKDIVSAKSKTEQVEKTASSTNQNNQNKENSTLEEKTIDEILEEHQQFLEEQAAASSRNTKSKDDNTEASSVNQQSIEKTADSKEKNSTNPTKTSTENVDLREEQKRIADQVVFPNVFSPDLDGLNDIFKMTVEQSIPIDNIQVSIVNLNGKVIGGFTGIYEGWDGRLLNGNLAPAGWYKYQAIIYLDGKEIPKVGGFNLKR